MSAPVSHLVFGAKILKKLPDIKNEHDFYVGVCFPDIRYLGIIDRNKTHYKVNGFNEVGTHSPFFSGCNCHIFLDTIREDYMQRSGLYSLVPQSKFVKMALKFYEDQLRLADFGQKKNLATFLNVVTPEELSFDLPQKEVEKWHSLVKSYIFSPLGTRDMQILTSNFIHGDEISAEILKLVPVLSKENRITSILNSFYHDFEIILEERKMYTDK